MAQEAPVVVAGAGIGGLALALCLHARGVPVRLLEGSAELRALGVGINLLPHAVGVLARLGLRERLAGVAVETAELAYHNRHGQRIWSEPRGLAAGYEVPQFSIHRGALQMALLGAVRERLGDGAVRLSARVVAAEGDGAGARALLEGGETVPGAAVVGADGIHSTLRRQHHPEEGPPAYSERVLWRATTEAPAFLTGRSMIMAGHRRTKFVAYPIRHLPGGRSLVNWIAELWRPGGAPPREDWNRVVEASAFAPDFAAWRFPWLDVPGLIAGASTVYEFPMVDRDPLPRWSRGRVTLLGDAAHPMYPIGSNGASQAILDAEALAEAWAEHAGDPEAALRAYEGRRRPATAAVVLANRRDGPEVVMQMAEDRAPGGFERVEDVFGPGELERVANAYKRVAGFALAPRAA